MSIDGIYDNNNIFNKILRGELPCVKVYEDSSTLAFMDIFPESDGHVLVIPKNKARNFLDMPPEEINSYMRVTQLLAIAIKDALKPDGIRVMQYNGEAATQTVFHLHFHIVPCYSGVNLKEHSTIEADKSELKKIADKIIASLNHTVSSTNNV